MTAFFQQPRYRFLLLFIGLYLFFYSFNYGYIGLTAPGSLYVRFLDEHLNYVRWLRDFLLWASTKLLNLFGYKTKTSMYELLVVGRSKIILVYSCLGFGVMSFFAAFVLAWPAKLMAKISFLFTGLIFIQALNILRFVLLGIYWKNASGHISLDHHTIFNLIIYLIIILALYIHINQQKKAAHGRN